MTDGRVLQHIPVLRDAVLAGLAVRPDGRYLDGTFGRGGHARAILAQLGPAGRLLLMDRDPEAIAHARAEFAADARVLIRHANFSALAEWDEARAGLDGILLDLGVSSPQLDDGARGFSFQSDAPLDMRMDPAAGFSAAEFLAQADEREIADVLWRYGEERMSRRIARAIVARRVEAPISTTLDLAGLVERTLGRRERNKHPATRTFQALRLHVNDELGSLERVLPAATAALNPGGRLAVISFH
ncbi:MAG TPA: 16S rRNA (cytosine(1402)-N(4))-methyltransferase RsmH, partial [Rhodanobacteraceae bacterium]|nr:16S rRNA (cytosine(1402)-N(4))-methyltransferase RsmH [Rhodanobacteraceae bacterium]